MRAGCNWHGNSCRRPIGADVMVGFPGETEGEFEETLAFIERLPFTYLHVFPYSGAPGHARSGSGRSDSRECSEIARPGSEAAGPAEERRVPSSVRRPRLERRNDRECEGGHIELSDRRDVCSRTFPAIGGSAHRRDHRQRPEGIIAVRGLSFLRDRPGAEKIHAIGHLHETGVARIRARVCGLDPEDAGKRELRRASSRGCPSGRWCPSIDRLRWQRLRFRRDRLRRAG